MGKNPHTKGGKTKTTSGHGSKGDKGIVRRRQHSQNKPAVNHAKKAPSNTRNQVQHFKIPLTKLDRILLIGEGDFSFAKSLWKNYEIGHLVATSFDSLDSLQQKYTDINNSLGDLRGNAESSTDKAGADSGDVDDWEGFSSDEANNKMFEALDANNVVVHHSIDATSLNKAHRKTLNRHAPFTKIFFNFPHTGGLSTDVNRQVRANQELLVAFFNNAKALITTPSRPARQDQAESDIEYDSTGEEVDNANKDVLTSGRILVTLFEGEPYTLWNIRDLARHAGLQVVESFQFPWSAFPGYKHARTIGDIVTGKDRADEGKRKGAWRGEERDARCYVLALKETSGKSPGVKKRKRGNESDSDG